MQPLKNKENANPVTLELSKGCETVQKDVEAFTVLAI